MAKKAKRISTNIFFIFGLIVMFGVVGADDFYTIEMAQCRPFNWKMFLLGVVLVAPTVMKGFKNGKQ